ALVAFDDKAGDFVRCGQRAFLGQRLQCFEAAAAGFDLELAALGLTHDEILEQAACSDVCPQLEVGKVIARFAHIARALRELLQGYGMDHRISPDRMNGAREDHEAHKPKGSLHSQFVMWDPRCWFRRQAQAARSKPWSPVRTAACGSG